MYIDSDNIGSTKQRKKRSEMKRYNRIIDGQFGIICGRDTIIFIKTGKGGDIYGYDNKYLNIADMLHERYGYSCVVSANPVGSKAEISEELETFYQYISEAREIFYVGISNGALAGAQQCWKSRLITKALLINGPLMINWPQTREGAEKFRGKDMHFVYGERDPSARYAGLIDLIDNSVCRYSLLKDVGHQIDGDVLGEEIIKFIAYGEGGTEIC